MTKVWVKDRALEQARARYGLVNLDVDVIRNDVREAIIARRVDRDGLKRTAVVWTAHGERRYIISWSRRQVNVEVALAGFRDPRTRRAA